MVAVDLVLLHVHPDLLLVLHRRFTALPFTIKQETLLDARFNAWPSCLFVIAAVSFFAVVCALAPFAATLAFGFVVQKSC